MELYIQPKIKPKHFNAGKRITQDEIRIISELYPDTSNQAIADKIGRSASAIKNLAIKYDLKKSKSYKESNPGCFKKGQKSWNKGLKKYMGPNRTSFKKDNKPANYKPMGTISIRYHRKDERTYKYIKTENGWILLQRYNWEKHNGRIPENCIVTLKDKDPMNCNIENLELISRKENMERNRNREKAAKSLRELWGKEWVHKQYGLRPLSKFANHVK